MLLIDKVEKIFSAISNQTTEGITVADMDGNYVFVNPAFCEMSGYTAEELLRLTVFDMKAPDQDHGSFKNSKEKMEGKPVKVNLQRKDGSAYFTEIIGDIIEIDNDKYVLGTIRNISEREEHEQKIKNLNADLEQMVHDRTEQLNQTIQELNVEVEQRKIAEQTAKESLAVKELLLKEITHRVKNNMQIISSLINLQKSTMADGTQDFLDQVSHRVQSMALIHETLYNTNEFDAVKFDNYTQSLVFYLSDSLKTPDVQIEKEIEDCSLPLDTATCLGMIMMELVTNSVKHAFPDGRKGKITISLKSDENDQIELCVSDNGIGFPEDIDLYTTASLGMQVVTSLTDQLEGSIDMKNDSGTRFTIRCPKGNA